MALKFSFLQQDLFIVSFFRNESPTPYGNIMYDRRIVRGNTYAQRTLPAVSLLNKDPQS